MVIKHAEHPLLKFILGTVRGDEGKREFLASAHSSLKIPGLPLIRRDHDLALLAGSLCDSRRPQIEDLNDERWVVSATSKAPTDNRFTVSHLLTEQDRLLMKMSAWIVELEGEEDPCPVLIVMPHAHPAVGVLGLWKTMPFDASSLHVVFAHGRGYEIDLDFTRMIGRAIEWRSRFIDDAARALPKPSPRRKGTVRR